MLVSLVILTSFANVLRAQASGVDATFGVVDRAVGEFVASLTADERKEFQKAGRKEDLALFNFGAGSRFRAKYFAAPPVSPVRKTYCGSDPNAYCDIDAASMDMVLRAWQVIRSEGQR